MHVAFTAEADLPVHGDLAEVAVARAVSGGADEAQAITVHAETFAVNFERAEVTLLRSHEQQSTEVTVFQDQKRGSSSFTGRMGMGTAVDAALEAAGAGVADEANRVLAEGPRRLSWVHGEAECDRRAMVETVLSCVHHIRQAYPKVRLDASHYSFTLRTLSFANSAGIRRHVQRGGYTFYTCFAGRDGDRSASLNYTALSTWQPLTELAEVGTLDRRLQETERSFEPRPIKEKLVGDLIIAPDCVPSMLRPLVQSLDGYNLYGGTTPYAGRLGEAVASPGFTLRNRPSWMGFPTGSDFDGDGVPTQDLDVIVDGRLESFLIDRFSSLKMGRPQTAGALNLYLEPGDASLEELIAQTERGVLLGRFSGGRPNRNLDFSGVAKNAFYIEDGKVQHALSETMVSGNLGQLIRDVKGLSSEVVNFGGGAYPWLAVGGATLSSG